MSAYAGPVADPTAGVPLWPLRAYCPRCGIDKGRRSEARPGICTDCAAVMPLVERAAWRTPKKSAA